MVGVRSAPAGERSPVAVSARLVLLCLAAGSIVVKGKAHDDTARLADRGLLSAMGMQPAGSCRAASPLGTPLHPLHR